MTYIRTGSCVRMCRLMRTYVQTDTYIRADRCLRAHLKINSRYWMMQKDLDVFQKARYLFLKPRYLFQKARHLFVGADYISPSQIRLFLLFRSSFHLNRNTRTINRLRMTGHPLILLSAAFIKSLQNLPSAFVFLILVEEVLRMKGGWKGGDEVSPHYQSPHKQGVSTANERRKEEVDFR